MEKLNKTETKKVIKILAKLLDYPTLQDNHKYIASSKFGELLMSIDLNDEVPTIFTRLRDSSKVINKEESIKRDFGEYSGKRNYHVFVKDIAILIDEFCYDVMVDKIKIIEDLGER